MLEWIGDVGGLSDGLFRLAGWLIAPFVSYSLKMSLLTLLPSQKTIMIDAKPKTSSFCCNWRRNIRTKRVEMLKAEKSLTKHLDLAKFLQRQRLLVITSLISMSSSQLNTIESELLDTGEKIESRD